MYRAFNRDLRIANLFTGGPFFSSPSSAPHQIDRVGIKNLFTGGAE